MTSKALKEQRKKEAIRKNRLQILCIIGGIAIVIGLVIRGARSSSQSTSTKDERRIAMETAACTPSIAGTTRYAGYGCYEYCNGKQREKKSGCSDSPDNSQERSGQPCVGLPDNAQRNGADAIDQIWDGNKRYPTTTGRYNEEVSNGECTFKCKVGFSWDATSCSLSVTNWDFDYTGGPQTFTALSDGNYQIELRGAQGYDTAYGGKGAYTKGTLYLEEGERLYVYVGDNRINEASFNGGGNNAPNGTQGAGPGGGATDVRLETGSWNLTSGLRSRIMVAAGGGGGSLHSNLAGGVGGALVGGFGVNNGNGTISQNAGGATQTTGGVGGISNFSAGRNGFAGAFGIGGDGETETIYGAGGGGGYYGGGGGADGSSNVGSAGGGSSFISGYTGAIAILSSSDTSPRKASDETTTCADGTTDIVCSYHYSGKIFTNGEMKAGNEEMPNPRGTGTITGNPGNGYAKITRRGN